MTGRYYAGIDIGSRMTKVVVIDGDILASHIVLTSPEQRKLANNVMREALTRAGLSFADLSFVVLIFISSDVHYIPEKEA